MFFGIVFLLFLPYNTLQPFLRKSLMKGGGLYMNSADIIFYLINLLLEEKEKDKKETLSEE